MSVATIPRAVRRGVRLGGAAGIAFAVLVAFLPPGLLSEARADVATNPFGTGGGFHPKPGEPMLVQADELIYDNDNNQVVASGNVKIYYSGYTLEAEKVTYIKSTGRLIATGRVKLTDASGIAVYAEQLDITDTFKDGFVQSLRVETPQQTHFAADRAERKNGETTTFFGGVYTACEPCKDHPEKPPIWQVKAETIVFNHVEKMIYFHHADLEFFGKPIAYFPYGSTPDPTVKRKTGVLTPGVEYAPVLGVGVTVPYFWALAPNYDVTLTPTYYTRQGLLTDVEWRHRLDTGQYSIEAAGIYQFDKTAFLRSGAGTYAQHDFRGAIRSVGEFNINEDWTLGWDGTLSTDRMFTRDYTVLNSDTDATTSQIHLTGLKDRDYFDARAYYFQILTDAPTVHQYDQDRQAWVAPVIDHNYIFDDPVLGGELSINSNLTALHRDADDPFSVQYVGDPKTYTYYGGVAGTFVRATTEVDWQKRIVTDNGQVVTPFASMRGDIFALNADGSSAGITSDPIATRFMPSVGFEWSWPILATIGTTSNVFEPMAQLIARPNEGDIGDLPNNDAQSLVFDDTNLFSRDKFSGFDRVEGGTRLNAGLHYLGTFANGASVDALVGQSYQLAGENSFAAHDIADTAAVSGLETRASDVVARVMFDNGAGTQFTARGRFDDKDFDLNRGELDATSRAGIVTSSLDYQYLRENQNGIIMGPTSLARGTASVNFAENWTVFGSLAYDLTKDAVASDDFGVTYSNSCVTISASYDETRVAYTDIPQSQKLLVRLQLRTLGEGSFNADLKGLLN